MSRTKRQRELTDLLKGYVLAMVKAEFAQTFRFSDVFSPAWRHRRFYTRPIPGAC